MERSSMTAPRFFVPITENLEQAEQIYRDFASNLTYPLGHPTARLFRISFHHNDFSCIAQVGREFEGWPNNDGVVQAIIEMTRLVWVYTPARGVLTQPPILVSPDKVTERVYFADYSPES